MKRYGYLCDGRVYDFAGGREGAQKVLRVYKVTDKNGVELLCRLDEGKKWWYPVDGSAPIRNMYLKGVEDVTEFWHGVCKESRV